MRVRALLMALSVLTTLGLWPAVAAAADRALLVGIDTYQDERVPPTPGAAMDADALAKVARDRFGFPPAAVRILRDGEATSERILKEFRSWLIEGTRPGDRVFFAYAGHGSQLKDDNGDEDDGFDETLAPFDVDPLTGKGQIRDDEFDGLIARLSGRRAVLVFDSCHSGTVARGLPLLTQFPQGGGARFLPRPDDFRRIWQAGEGQQFRGEPPSYVLSGVAGEPAQSVVDDPSKVGRLTGIVVISAAGPGQLAYPIEVDGGYRGALSYLLQDVYAQGDLSRALFDNIRQKAVTGVGSVVKGAAHDLVTGTPVSVEGALTEAGQKITLGTLETTINDGMKSLQKSGKLQGNQEPWFEVISEQPLRNAPLFGDWQQTPAVALNNPVAERLVTLATVGNRTTFEEGENLVFEVSTDQPGYLYLLVFSEEKVATCIFPNPEDPDNRVTAGTRRLPATDRYDFPVQAPYGSDVVVALVSQDQKDICTKVTSTWDEVFARVDLGAIQEDLRQRAQRRGVGVQMKAPAQVAGWQAATLILETRPAGKGRP